VLPRITTTSPVRNIYRKPAGMTFAVAAATVAVSAAITAGLAGPGNPPATAASVTRVAVKGHAAHAGTGLRSRAVHRAAGKATTPWHPVLGLDSIQRVPSSALFHTGVHFEARYIVPGNPKSLTRAELATLQRYGTRVVAVWEDGAMDMLGGYQAGKWAAQRAQRGLTSLGIPGAAIYFAADFAVSPQQQGAVNDYLRGAASVVGLRRTGLYGSYGAIKGAFDARVIQYGWQTYAWSGGLWDPRAALRQYSVDQYRAGTVVDLNVAVHRDYGAVYPGRG
jgi:Rv2525c-like, glycoside hydrolase-like domain